MSCEMGATTNALSCEMKRLQLMHCPVKWGLQLVHCPVKVTTKALSRETGAACNALSCEMERLQLMHYSLK
jgi:hypothetical protein